MNGRTGTLALVALIVSTFFFGCRGSKEANSTDDFDMSNLIILDTINVKPPRKNTAPYQPAATRYFDLKHTKLAVSFDWEKQHVFGEATLELEPYFYSTDTLVLDAKGFDLHEVSLIDKAGQSKKAEYKYNGTKLVVDLEKQHQMGELVTIYIDYTAKPNELDVQGSNAIRDDRGLYFINPTGEEEDKPTQLWTQGEPEANSCWFPTIDNPNEKTTQEIKITVDNKYVTLSNGRYMESTYNEDSTKRTDYWMQDQPHSPYLVMMAVGEFAVVNDVWRDLQVDYYVEPEYEAYAKDIFGNTPEMMEHFSNILGVDYPWAKYSQIVVRDFISGAMENTSASIYYSALHKTKRELLDRDYEDIIAHELFHHWFGDLVTAESWANLALNESFATYGEYIWSDYKYGRVEADYEMQQNLRKYLQESQDKQVDVVRFYHNSPGEMFDRHSYEKGACILHMLRDDVGDEAFFASINYYLNENIYQSAEMHEVRLAFEEITGRDLNWFFNQWFYSSGHPILEINHDYKGDSLTIMIEQTASAESKLIYQLPIKIDIHLTDTVIRKSVVIDERRELFIYKLKEDPKWVSVDAEKVLLCEKVEDKSYEEWEYQYMNSDLYVDRFEAVKNLIDLQEDEQSARNLAYAALDDEHWYIRQLVLERFEMNLEYPQDVTDKVIHLAQHDGNSKVRAAALDLLTTTKDGDFKEVFEVAVGDSSYKVSAAALTALGKADAPRSLELASKYEETDNYYLAQAVAMIYSTNGNSDYQDFFETQIPKSDDYAKYDLLYYYGNFLGRMDKPEVEIGIETLKANALDFDSKWISYAGKGGLKRIKSGFELRKDKAEAELKNTEEFDLAAKMKLEEKVEEAEDVIAMVDRSLDEIAIKKKALQN